MKSEKNWEQTEFGFDFIGDSERNSEDWTGKKGDQLRLFPESETWRRDPNQDRDEKGEDERTKTAKL